MLHVHHILHSRHRVHGRAFRVWQPDEKTSDPHRRYPVLYLQDGQRVFGEAAAAGHPTWRADLTAQRLVAAGKLPPLILVAVDHAGAHRIDDYTPIAWRGRGGHADDFAAMLVDEIKPFVDAHYPTRPEREATAIAGSSLGGLFALHAALARSDVFGAVAALSPSTWWANGAMLRTLAALPARLPLRIGLDAGAREAPALRQSVRAAADQLVAKGWTKHRVAARATLRHQEVARARHDEASWGQRFDRVLKFLFPKPARPPRRKQGRRRATVKS